MDFRSWVDTQPWGTLKRLERELGIGWTTLAKVMRGGHCNEKNANLLSNATGGMVSVQELQYVPKQGMRAPKAGLRKARTRRTIARTLARIQAKELKKTG